MEKETNPLGNNIKAVVFDCDGVMFDSAEANRRYYDAVLARFGKPPMDEQDFAYAHMHTAFETLERLFGSGEGLKKALQAAKDLTYFPFVRLMRMEPYLMHLLTWLKPNYHLAVATNRTNTMDAVISEHGLTGFFDLVVTSMDVKAPKPDPGQLYKIMEAYSLSGDQVAYLGDSVVDEQAARTAGVKFVAVANPNLEADVHIKMLVEMEDILGRQ
ncbi:HAD family hydrolase [Desulfatibacillum aliphaticivorans]|uniref:phosphoglycolate phosphatase n=1 Tax=Desulfatibacillum aliphaticivorans TaxID=218208 RepID=B8FLN4_DESAL|nr:HAD family hydrolase [Desulfatibacillum aliphaticivorans]ACL05388.1 HAD-superfamily hydrolase, subfamily IA, variant 1 [Desulfatibacillum aliphaticivorans]